MKTVIDVLKKDFNKLVEDSKKRRKISYKEEWLMRSSFYDGVLSYQKYLARGKV